ncbi:MAG: ATP-binding cassette domain-containing protein [candidate division WOR-3 bacterium]
MIKIINITKKFNDRLILDNINFEVTNNLLAILGPTGSGKTVLLKIIVGLIKPDAGQILIDKNESIGFVFQHSALFDSLTVRQNISLPLEEKTNLSKREINEQVLKIADLLNINQAFLNKNCQELSGGERKIVAIARAIINNPTYLFYDEPTTGLDPITHDRVCSIIKNLAKPGIIVTHSEPTIKMVEAQPIFHLKSAKLLSTKEYYEQS